MDDSGVKQKGAEQATAYQERGKNKKKPVSANSRADDLKAVILQKPFQTVHGERSQMSRVVVEIESVRTVKPGEVKRRDEQGANARDLDEQFTMWLKYSPRFTKEMPYVFEVFKEMHCRQAVDAFGAER
jgi:hypothetical protein